MNEMKALMTCGFCSTVDEKMYEVKLGALICDAPANLLSNVLKLIMVITVVKGVSNVDSGLVKLFYLICQHH